MLSTTLRSWRTLPGQSKAQQPVPGGRRHALDLLAVLRGELLEEIVDQDGDVLAPLAQRRQADA